MLSLALNTTSPFDRRDLKIICIVHGDGNDASINSKRGGAVYLIRFRVFVKWFSASVEPRGLQAMTI